MKDKTEKPNQTTGRRDTVDVGVMAVDAVEMSSSIHSCEDCRHAATYNEDKQIWCFNYDTQVGGSEWAECEYFREP